MTRFLLDSGDIKEYEEIVQLAKAQSSELWGATTNPTLIAKTLTGKKLTQTEAFNLQKEIVLRIIDLVPGAVSAEVYADESTVSEEMVQQGEEIASWHKRIYVKLPTTLEGFKARTVLREKNIPINNTLVFSQQQIFAINLHEKIITQKNPNIKNIWPPFISPFVGRLDDNGQNGMQLIENGMKIKEQFYSKDDKGLTWMLASSIRNAQHIKQSITFNSELITAPAKAYREWFGLTQKQQNELDINIYGKGLADISNWPPPQILMKINSIPEFMDAIQRNQLDIRHALTDSGIHRFAADWNAIIDRN